MQVSVGGFYATGGSALRDLLRDDPDVAVFPNEFRLLKEYSGLLSLQRDLRDSKLPESRDLALRDFIWLAENLGKAGRLRFLQRPGFGYDSFTGGNFSRATASFVNNLTMFHYRTDWHFYQWRKGHLEFWFDAIRAHIFGRQTGWEAHAISHDEVFFAQAARTYLDEIFAAARRYLGAHSSDPVVLHNAVDPSSISGIKMAQALLPELKVIIVDRDPRDNFLSLPPGRALPAGREIDRAVAYVDMYRELRKELPAILGLPGVLLVKFEDLVLAAASERARVRGFLGLDPAAGVAKFGPNFIPEQSERNLGLWRKVKSRETLKAISYIETNLLADT